MIAWLRDAAWMTPERLRLYGLLGALLSLALLAAFLRVVLGGDGSVPGDVDFVAFYAAARLGLDGPPEAAWDQDLHAAARDAALGARARIYPFLHPPTFLLILLPLALLPYGAAMAAWVLGTGAAFLAALRAWGVGRWSLLAAALSPAAVLNAAHGQTGFLTAALLAAAGLGIGVRPWLAGIGFALLATKPQLGLLVLPALLAARRWAEIGWGAVFLGLHLLATLALFGPQAWRDFAGLGLAYQEVVRGGTLAAWKLQSVAAFATTAGFGGAAAMMLQGVVAIAVMVAVAAILRRRPGGRAEAAAIGAGLPLVTPYILMYDLVILLLPMAWVMTEAQRTGFLPWERIVLLAALVVPGVALVAGLGAGISVTAPVAAALLAVVLRRIGAGRSGT
ncbi:glycosyltransferase 87 family protein [Neoroseomonas soli]|uniref:DUF2029 domain-containing protein n=1 Tax=Neoroseomonas soli TaxID=1081025 RepID=A0A9X9X202_9PROT|nr:glycosyltransferase 87 family protein [Neoroseomonas soli]MBR0673431.1 DUF2029 domain-containing protein [Neoroseomonas soli]